MGVFTLQSVVQRRRRALARVARTDAPTFAVLDGPAFAHTVRERLALARATFARPTPDLAGGDGPAIYALTRATVEAWAVRHNIFVVAAVFDGNTPPQVKARSDGRTMQSRDEEVNSALDEAARLLEDGESAPSAEARDRLAKAARPGAARLMSACKEGLLQAILVGPPGASTRTRVAGVKCVQAFGQADGLLAACCDPKTWRAMDLLASDVQPTAVISRDSDLAVIRGSTLIPLWSLAQPPAVQFVRSPGLVLAMCQSGMTSGADAQRVVAAPALAPASGPSRGRRRPEVVAAAMDVLRVPIQAAFDEQDALARGAAEPLLVDAVSLCEGLGILDFVKEEFGLGGEALLSASHRLLVEACMLAGTDETMPLLRGAGLLMPPVMRMGEATARGWKIRVPLKPAGDGDDKADAGDAESEASTQEEDDDAGADDDATAATGGHASAATGRRCFALEMAVWRVLGSESATFLDVDEVRRFRIADTSSAGPTEACSEAALLLGQLSAISALHGAAERGESTWDQLVAAAEECSHGFATLVNPHTPTQPDQVAWMWRRGLALAAVSEWAASTNAIRASDRSIRIPVAPADSDFMWALGAVEGAALATVTQGLWSDSASGCDEPTARAVVGEILRNKPQQLVDLAACAGGMQSLPGRCEPWTERMKLFRPRRRLTGSPASPLTWAAATQDLTMVWPDWDAAVGAARFCATRTDHRLDALGCVRCSRRPG
ncbi:hypothetical protein FNF28_06744 [Cafeteria roenbergensis]|uniref:Uncharacterized protein n=1 Tax=Cafeteria roenbergensis TaxID=33653 RepID=A0A5A8CS20_CAFRO|nr:hypothetical protein FNF28_06744 [Cafeteria roenbergensis]